MPWPASACPWSRIALRAGQSDHAVGGDDRDSVERTEALAVASGTLGFDVSMDETVDAAGWWAWTLQAIEAVAAVLAAGP